MKKSNIFKKNYSHSILADYYDQFSIRINNKGEHIHIKPLDSFSFQSIVPFESKHKSFTKNQTKSLLQQSTILNDTDILSVEDEPNQSQNMKNQNTNIFIEQTLAIQFPSNLNTVINKFHFLIHLSSNTKDTFIISSYQMILK